MQVCPLDEYGTIGTALLWNPETCSETFDTEDGHFVGLKPTADGVINYSFMAVWFRGSDEKPASMSNFTATVKKNCAGV